MAELVPLLRQLAMADCAFLETLAQVAISVAGTAMQQTEQPVQHCVTFRPRPRDAQLVPGERECALHVSGSHAPPCTSCMGL